MNFKRLENLVSDFDPETLENYEELTEILLDVAQSENKMDFYKTFDIIEEEEELINVLCRYAIGHKNAVGMDTLYNELNCDMDFDSYNELLENDDIEDYKRYGLKYFYDYDDLEAFKEKILGYLYDNQFISNTDMYGIYGDLNRYNGLFKEKQEYILNKIKETPIH